MKVLPAGDAAALAVEHLHVAPSTTALTADALRGRLEAVVLQAALDSHYREHPKARPSLSEVAVAAVQLDGHPLASRPDLLRRAAAEVVESHPDADADAVLREGKGVPLDVVVPGATVHAVADRGPVTIVTSDPDDTAVVVDPVRATIVTS